MDNNFAIEYVTIADAKDILAIYAPYVTDTAISFEYEVPSLLTFQKRIADISAKYPYLKAVRDGEIVGYAYAGPFKARKAYDWSVETTVYVKQSERNRGIGAKLYEVLQQALIDMGILNMNACIAVTDTPDEHLTNASRQFHQKMGFALVGTFHQSGYKFDTWYDMIWMEKMIGPHQPKPRAVQFGTVHD